MRFVEEEEKWWIPSPPAAWRKRLRIILSKDEATPLTACRWGFYFLGETRLPGGL